MPESQARPILPPSTLRAGEPVLTGSVIATLVDEIRDLFRELSQWRAYGAAVQRVQTWPGYDDLPGAIEAELAVEQRRLARELQWQAAEMRRKLGVDEVRHQGGVPADAQRGGSDPTNPPHTLPLTMDKIGDTCDIAGSGWPAEPEHTDVPSDANPENLFPNGCVVDEMMGRRA